MATSIDIVAILEGFLSSNDTVRREAQLWLETTNLDVVLVELLRALETATDIEIRGLAAVLLKSRINNAHKNDSPSPAGSLEKYDRFIHDDVAPRERDISVRNRLSGTVALIADVCFPEGQEWVELWQLITNWLGRRSTETPNDSEDVICRIGALNLLSRLAEIPSTLKLLEQHSDFFLKSLSQSLDPSSLFEEQRVAFEVIASIEQGISSNNIESFVVAKALGTKTKRQPSQYSILKRMLRSFVPMALTVLEHTIKKYFDGSEIEELSYLLDITGDITDADPLFWIDSIKNMLTLMCHIILSKDVNFHLRQSALRLMTRASAGCLRKSAMASTFRNSQSPEASEGDCIVDALCEFVQKLASQTPSFVESDEEWMKHREDEPMNPSESEDILEVLCSLMGEFLHDAGSPAADNRVLSMSINLFAFSTPVAAVVGLRLLSQVISERSQSVEKSADNILVQIITRLNPPEGSPTAADIRYRWWMLMVLCDLFGTYGPELQLTRPRESLACLAHVIRSDSVIRCKCRALTALYAFLAPFEDDTPAEFIDTFTEPLLKDIIIPAVQTDHDELQELGLALATVLAGVIGEPFAKYYDDCMGAVINILRMGMESRQSGHLNPRREFYLCEAAVGLASKLVVSVKVNSQSNYKRQDLSFLCDAFTSIMVALIKRDHESEDTSLTIPTLLRGVATLATTVGNSFAPYVPVYADCIFHILKQVDAAQMTYGTGVMGLSQQGLESRQAVRDLAHGALGRVAQGKVECVEGGGVTQLCVKGRDGEDRIIEFKTRIIEEKVAALESLVDVLDAVGKDWIPLIPQTTELLKNELDSNYSIIRKPALEVATHLLSSLLPSESEMNIENSKSQCALAAGAITMDDFFYLAVDLISFLLVKLNQYQTARAAEVIPAIENLTDSLQEAASFFPVPNNEMSKDFTNKIFEEFGKRMVITMSNEITKLNDTEEESSSSKQIENEDVWLDTDQSSSEGSDSETDPEGTIYGGIMRSVGRIMNIFDAEQCTALFMTHLNTAFSGLLTVPNANMAGRAAALCIFGTILESGDPLIRQQIAADIIPIVLLYARCNEVPQSISQKISSGLVCEEIYDEDVERIQAATYCLGIIALTAPEVFLNSWDASILVLRDAVNHPQAATTERRPATECAIGALLKIYTSLNLRAKVKIIDPTDQSLEQLISKWLPLQVDEDESRTVTSLLVDFILENRIPEILGKPSIKIQLAKFFRLLAVAVKENPSLVLKETRVSGRLEQAERRLAF